MSNDSIIIVGPAGCGKTRNAQRLASLFSLANVVDEDNWLLSKTVKPNTLYLCTEVPEWAVGKAYVIPFGAAMRALPFPPDDAPRHPRGLARIEGNEIVIRVPISAIPFAAECMDANLYGNQSPTFRVSDLDAFASEIVLQLNCEEEDGSTPITQLLDNAMDQAIDSGCEGVDFN